MLLKDRMRSFFAQSTTNQQNAQVNEAFSSASPRQSEGKSLRRFEELALK